jgi:hypothetical protein
VQGRFDCTRDGIGNPLWGFAYALGVLFSLLLIQFDADESV